LPDARAAWREGAVVVFAFGCLSIVATFPLVLRLGRALPSDLGDPLFTSWLLGWDADRLRHGLSDFWDAPILFPSRHTIAFSEHMLGIAVFAAPAIWLTGNPILGYDLAFIFTYVLAGSGMYLLAQSLTGRRDAAFLAGLAFAFGPPRALHVSHLQVLASGWMPIALWGLHQYFARRSAIALAVFAGAFTVQALSNGYCLYYHPREIVIESRSAGSPTVLYHGRSLAAFGQALAAGSSYPWIVISLPVNSTRTMTIRQTGRTRRWFWSVHELAVWER
jgi:hypothetical protein